MTPTRRRVLEGVIATLGLYMQRIGYNEPEALLEFGNRIVRAGRAIRARGRGKRVERWTKHLPGS